MNLHSEEVGTVGGLIMAALGHLAQPGESVMYDQVRFEVESMEGLAVNTALLYLPAPPANQPESDSAPQSTESTEHATTPFNVD